MADGMAAHHAHHHVPAARNQGAKILEGDRKNPDVKIAFGDFANTLAATGGASTRELMHRMGHSSARAALIDQHLVNGRDHVIADYVDGQIRKVKRPPHSPSGT
ncbi:hypothetical protein ACFWN5_10435 [Streptomyces sp. NPDC058430]|uniref:hypothetical protein n=1 Tax=Streptomyces sp. NPDC058430 TaxID=3346495 RepID=UPI003665829C